MHIRTLGKPVALPAVLLLLGACGAGHHVRTDFDPQATFTELQRYDWADSLEIVDESLLASPFLARRIRRAVDENLTARGFTLDTLGTIDFVVSAFVIDPRAAGRLRGGRSAGVAFSFGVGFGHYYPFSAFSPHPFGLSSRLFYPRYRFGHAYVPIYHSGYGPLWTRYGGQPADRPGTLVIDVFSAQTGELIWRGWADGALIGMPEGEKGQPYLNEAVAAILKDFPPQPKGR